MDLLSSMLEAFQDPQKRHALVVHTPIVLAMLAPVLAAVSALLRARNTTLRWVCLACFAGLLLSAFAGTITGESAMAEMGDAPAEVRQVAHDHEEMAEKIWIFAAIGLALAAGAWLKKPKHALLSTAAAAAAGGLGAAWVAVTAHHGGTLVYAYGVGTPSPLTQADLDRAAGLVPEDQPAFADPRAAFFVAEIKPLLDARCASCHGDDEFAESDLSVVSPQGLLKGGIRGPSIVPGDPDASLLVKSVKGEAGFGRMPYSGDPLTEAQIEALARWIAEGAVWTEER